MTDIETHVITEATLVPTDAIEANVVAVNGVPAPPVFRCPHRPWKENPNVSRADFARLRAKQYPVPTDATWTEKAHDYDPGKSVQRKVLGQKVSVKLYEHETGRYWEALVDCPDCGDTILISTDVDPTTKD